MGPTAMAHLTPPDVSKIDIPLGHRLYVSLAAELFWKTQSTDNNEALVRNKKDSDNHVRMEPHFRADVYVFVENPLLMALAADLMAYETYSGSRPVPRDHSKKSVLESCPPRSTKMLSEKPYRSVD